MSAKKKRSAVTRCEHCECHYLSDSESPASRLRQSAVMPRGSATNGQRNSPLAAARSVPISAGDGVNLAADKIASLRTPNTPSTSSCTHGDLWGSDNFTQCVVPHVGVRALAHNLDKRNALLPAESTGWERRHITLINDETLAQLGVLPRTPVAVTSDGVDGGNHSNITILWPCSDVTQMRVSIGDLPATTTTAAESGVKKLRLQTVLPRRLASLQLALAGGGDFEKRLAAQKGNHFLYYLRAYLCNAFLSDSQPIIVEFYTRKLCFHIIDAQFVDAAFSSDLNAAMNRLSLAAMPIDRPSSCAVEVLSVTTDTDIRLVWSNQTNDDEDNVR